MEGWIIDAYADYQRDSLVTWLWTPQGVRRIADPAYRPRFYVHGGRGDLEVMKRRLAHLDRVEEVEWASKKTDIRSTEAVPVLDVLPRHYRDLHPLAELVNREGQFHDFRLYDVDLRHSQRYFLQHDILPLSRTAYDGAWKRLEEPFALEYELPPLNEQCLDIQVDAPEGLPRYEDRLRGARLGETVLEGSEEAILEGLNRALLEEDPDILLTVNGDPFVIPYLLQKAETHGVDLVLGRERQRFQHGEGKSYFTYGKIVYKPTQYLLRGRLHLDANHFAHRESGLHGLAEMSRLARLVPQEMLRLTPGTAITAMQVNEAHWRGYVVLWKKNLPEAFKTAEELVLCDRGGFILEPRVGIHEGIVEVDYASLYPQIMRTFNISPETIFCPCCKEDGMVAPGIGHHTCVRRRGLIPVYLDPVLERKRYYKQRKREAGPNQAVYEARDCILKWMLVTCYDGDTLVPFKKDGVAKLAPISETIDPYLPEGPGVIPAPRDMCAYGLDDEGRPVEKPIKKLIKSPAPKTMLRISLVGGRELVVTPNHQFFVQSEGSLERKRADSLEVGERLSIAGGWKPNGEHLAQSLNVAYVLSRNNDLKDLECWRVRGPGIRKRMQSHFRIIFRHATNAGYTDQSPYIWKDTGVIPLRFLPLLRLPLPEWNSLEVGHTRRHGGKLNFLPARIEIDYDLGFLVGFFIGDGSGTGNMIRLYVGMDESEIVGKLLGIVDKKFGLIGVVRKETHARMWVVQFNSNGLTRIFRDVLHVGPSAKKGKLVIPEWLLNASEAAKRGFIAGLIASDGAINPGGFALIASASRPFLESLRLLVGTINIPSRLYTTRGRDKRYPLFGLRLNVEDLDGIWLKDFHRAKVDAFPPEGSKRRTGDTPFQRVKSIGSMPPGSPFVYCFEVDGEPNGFLVEGMVFAGNSFGYMGYSNARYGRIECHEAINAYAREILVRSVHIAEAHGYEVVHGIVDSLWLRPLPGHAPVEEVVQRIQDDIGLPLDLEGTYHWIVFLPCKTTGVGALNRYYGLFEDGEMKLRGIEVRRHDTSPFIVQAQTGMLEVFRQARNAREFQDAIPAAIQVLREAAGNLGKGRVPLEDLVISKVVTKPLEEYVVLNDTAAALRQLRARGFKVEPGEYVRYVITDRRTRDYRRKVKFAAFLQEGDTPDAWEYLRLLARSGETLLAPFGYTEEGLLRELS
ncbi:MAG: DNA polymerase domain-containing protein [Thermoplasmata archaeon]